MKNRPPCCGLWLPCARDAYFLIIDEPSGQVPGSSASMEGVSLHVQDTAAVTRTSGVPSTGHLRGFASMTSSGRVAQVHTESSRIGTRVIPHFGHLPARSSITSSSPAIVHTYEIGGSAM